ncbi:hypothetical protein EGJ55_16465 [Pseudomonas moraviensis]|nr:hypothetical protein EGJ55_16465 [Pseudomonas moraviensis]
MREQARSHRNLQCLRVDRSHAPRGNAARDALRPPELERGASLEAFPRRAWERSSTAPVPHQQWE